MKRTLSAGRSVVAALVLLAPPSLPAAEPTEALFQKALFEEEGRRDLPAAIRAYETVIQAVDEQRRLAATAVFRLGECYRKLGRTNDAVAQYQRLVRDFSAEEVLARLSRQNLKVLGVPDPVLPATPAVAVASVPTGGAPVASPTPVAAASPAVRERQRELLEAELALLESDRTETQRRVEKGVASTADLRAIERQVLQMKRQLVGLSDPDSLAAPAGSPADAGIPASERTEVARLESMIANSPDLLETPAGDPRLTPLHRAAREGQAAVVRFLVSKGANVNSTRVTDGRTPLHVAAASGHRSVVEILLAKGGDPNQPASDGSLPLASAVERGFRELVRTLLAGGADVNALGGPAEQRRLRVLVDVSGEVTISRCTALHVAARTGALPLLADLLAAGAKLDATNSAGFTALHEAVMFRKEAAVEAILRAKANPNPKGGYLDLSPLDLALVPGTDPSPSSGTVRRLIEAGADLQQRDGFGYTPLLLAVGQKVFLQGARWGANLEAVAALLKAGADPNARVLNADGRPTGGNLLVGTALGIAVELGETGVVRALLDAGARINEPEATGKGTALHAAVARLNREMVELLLARGADPAVSNSVGQSSLALVRPAVPSAFQFGPDGVPLPVASVAFNGDGPAGIPVLPPPGRSPVLPNRPGARAGSPPATPADIFGILEKATPGGGTNATARVPGPRP